MDAPTASDIRALSRIDFDSLDWGEPTGSDPDRLAEEMGAIIPWLEDTTGYYFGSTLPSDMPSTTLSIPTRKESQFRKAVRMLVEWEAYRQHPDQVEGVIDIDIVASFTAGTYFEQRRTAQEALLIGDQIHPWPELNSLLTGLLSPAKGSIHEVPIVGFRDERYRGGAEIIERNLGPCRSGYDPYNMGPWHRGLVNYNIPITGLPNG